MKSFLPNVVWIFDDKVDWSNLALTELRRRRPVGDEDLCRSDTIATEVLSWFNEPRFLCDVMLLDIVGAGEETWIENVLHDREEIATLSNLSGVRLLTHLRQAWPRLPVVMVSGYLALQRYAKLGDVLRSLTRRSVCCLPKTSSYMLPHVLWIAQQAIVGVRVAPHLASSVSLVLDEVNASQNHFYFVQCSDDRDLISPPREILESAQTAMDRLCLFEAWNSRALAFLDDSSSNEENASVPLLPFGGEPLRSFRMQLLTDLRNMGESYLRPYLIRECARVAYRLFFEVASHPLDTGECIFDASTEAPDLLPGIARGKICPRCQLQLTQEAQGESGQRQRIHTNASGGWSCGRREAADAIAKLAGARLASL